MTNRLTKILVGGLTALSMILLPGVAMAQPTPVMPMDPSADEVVLDLYNLTDVHGHIEQVKHYKTGAVTEAGAVAVGCYLKQARETNPNSSFTLLGDNVGASPFTTGILYDNPTIAALNKLQPLASTIGNHELDLGQDVFKARVNGTKATVNGDEIQFEKVEFPYLGANVKGLGDALGDYVVWESPSGVKVAFIGAIAEDVPYKLSPGTTDGMTFDNPIPVLNNTAKKLKDEGTADVVIAMLDDDVKNNLPNMGSYIDGLMGGDTHVPYAFTMANGADGHKLSGTASGSYMDNLSNLKITYDKTAKKVVSSKVELIPAATVAECTEDPYGIQPIVDKAVADSKAAGEKVIATGITSSFKRAVHETSDGGPQGAGSNRGHESSLGDLVADSIKGTVLTADRKPVDIGIINAGGLRADLVPNPDGTLTYAQTYAVEPFGNELGYVTLKGKDFKDALEQQWKTNLNSQNSRPMLKLGISSNVSYTYDPTRPYGDRITSVLINGQALNPEADYTVASVTFLLDGGDSFDALTRNGKPVTFGNLDREKFNEYLANNPGVTPRMTKSSVGVTVPAEPVVEGEDAVIQLRGLAFTEGPAHEVEKVEVSLKNGNTGSSKVDLSLVDDNAESETDAVITTDGAGRAEVSVSTLDLCEGNLGKVVDVPLIVANYIGGKSYTVVGYEHGLSFQVQCSEQGVVAIEGSPGLKPNQVYAGDEITVEAQGFEPGEDVEFWLHSTPQKLGVSKANSKGIATLTARIPANTKPGAHRIHANQGNLSASTKIEVLLKPKPPVTGDTGAAGSATVKAKTGLARTGADSWQLGLVALLLAAAGGLALSLRRRDS